MHNGGVAESKCRMSGVVYFCAGSVYVKSTKMLMQLLRSWGRKSCPPSRPLSASHSPLQPSEDCSALDYYEDQARSRNSSARQAGKVGQVIRPCSAMSFSSACSNIQYLIASRDAVDHQSKLNGEEPDPGESVLLIRSANSGRF